MTPARRGTGPSKTPGKAVDITMPVEEGDRYRLKEITFTGNKAVTNTRALRAQFKIKDGDIFDTEAIRKGLENLRKAYAALGLHQLHACAEYRAE